VSSRFVGRLATLTIITTLFAASTVQSAIIGLTTLIKNPPGVAFASPDAALGAPWVSYRLSLASTNGEIIQAIQANITGQLHQRWNPDPDNDGAFLPTAQSTNITNGDTHLMAPSGSLFGSGPTEDDPGTGSPLASTASAKYGVGTLLQGAWSLVGANVGSTANVAYIVIPKGTEPNTVISVQVANPDGAVIGTLTAADFGLGFGFPLNPPVVNNLDLTNPVNCLNCTVSGTITATNNPTSWSPPLNSLVLQSYTPNYGASGGLGPIAATLWDPATQQFSWNTTGAKGGDYVWGVSATNAGGTGNGTITVHIFSPEPSSLLLAALALFGAVVFTRRR
jgi:hypothetical protein